MYLLHAFIHHVTISLTVNKMTVSVGSNIVSDAIVHIGFVGNVPDAQRTMRSLLENKKVLLVTLPGAFTPT